MLRPNCLKRCLHSLSRAVWFGFTLWILAAPLSAGEIRWTGDAAVRFATGTDFNNLVPLGDPLFTLGAPGSISVSAAGINWSLVLLQDPRRYIQVAIFASPLKAEARAIDPTLTYQQTQRVQLQASFAISGVGPSGASMTASPSGSLFTTGQLTNTLGVIDSVKSLGTLSYAEEGVANVDPSASLFASQRTWQYERTDGGPPLNIRPSPWDDEVGWKSDGTYRLTMEIDLRALATGNDREDWASATWGQKFMYQQSFLSFVDAVPEPSTALLTALALGSLGVFRWARAVGR
jgi:hypothetical protein